MAKTKSQLLTKIDYLLVDIQSQYSEIKKNNNFDPVDLTLVEANIASLAKHFEALKIYALSNTTQQNSSPNKETIFTPPTETKKVYDKQEVFEEINEDIESAIEEPVQQSEFAFDVESITNPTETAPVAEMPVEERVEAEEKEVVVPVIEPAKEINIPVQSIVAEVKSTDDTPSRPMTINEIIQQQKQAGVNVTQQFQTSTTQDKVVDLKTAVSLNDKLLYIKDLFNGYSLAYSEAIELLNRFDSFAEADAFLQANYAVKNGWSEKSQTVEKFYSLLRKKFTA